MTFQKGNIPWTKGKKGYTNKGSFKKGQHPSSKTEFKNGRPKPKNAYEFGKAEKNNRWNGGKTLTRGYIKILKKDHPFADKYGYVLEHRLVMEKKLGRYLTRKERIHHINGIRDDNRIKNLMLFSSNSAHTKFHSKLRGRVLPRPTQ